MSDNAPNAIADEKQYNLATRALSERKQPPAILRMLMNALESYRQARKYGWSRPWNKYHLMNFQSFKLSPADDGVLISLGSEVLGALADQMPSEAREFVADLLASGEELMGFIFCHEFDDPDGGRYEGATLSLGRKNAKRYRDRIDIIVESQVDGDLSTGFSRVRVFIDPYRQGVTPPLWKCTLGAVEAPVEVARLFNALADISWQWADRNDKIWHHWTSDYIDYFGDRRWQLENPLFWSYHRERDVA